MRSKILFVSLAFVCLFCGAVSAEVYENPPGTYTPNIPNSNVVIAPGPTGKYNTLVPYITVSEEFNDNIFLTSDNQQTDFITQVTPGLTLDYDSPFWTWKADASVSYLYFAKGTEGDQSYPTVRVWGSMRPVRNLVYLDISDSYWRVPLNYGYESLFVNQANENFLTVSPYLKFHPLRRLELSVGYIYNNVIYDQSNTINWQEHDVFVRATHELTPRSSLFARLLYAYTVTSDNYNYDRLTASLGMDYNYADRSHIYVEGGYSLIGLDGGSNFASPYWNVGINYAFGPWVAFASGRVTYNTDPYQNITERRTISGGLTRELPRGSISLAAYYYTTKDYLIDSVYQKSYGLTLSATHEFSERLRGYFSAGIGREHGTTFAYGFPFFNNPLVGPTYDLISIDSGLNYGVGDNLTLFCSYGHRSYLYEDSPNVDNNRVIVGLTKAFRGWKF